MNQEKPTGGVWTKFCTRCGEKIPATMDDRDHACPPSISQEKMEWDIDEFVRDLTSVTTAPMAKSKVRRILTSAYEKGAEKAMQQRDAEVDAAWDKGYERAMAKYAPEEYMIMLQQRQSPTNNNGK